MSKKKITFEKILNICYFYSQKKKLKKEQTIEELISFLIRNNIFLIEIKNILSELKGEIWDDEDDYYNALVEYLLTKTDNIQEQVDCFNLLEYKNISDLLTNIFKNESDCLIYRPITDEDMSFLKQEEEKLRKRFDDFNFERFDLLNNISIYIDNYGLPCSFNIRPIADNYIIGREHSYGNLSTILSIKLRKSKNKNPIPDLKTRLDLMKKEYNLLKSDFNVFYQKIEKVFVDLDLLEDYYSKWDGEVLETPFRQSFFDILIYEKNQTIYQWLEEFRENISDTKRKLFIICI